MNFQKSRWKAHRLEITEAVLTRDADLVPLIVLMHDAAVDYWESEVCSAARVRGQQVLYFDAVKAAGLDAISKYVGDIQRGRSEVHPSNRETTQVFSPGLSC